MLRSNGSALTLSMSYENGRCSLREYLGCFAKRLSFISNRQRRREGKFCASELAWIESTPPAPAEQSMHLSTSGPACGPVICNGESCRRQRPPIPLDLARRCQFDFAVTPSRGRRGQEREHLGRFALAVL